jgi:acetyl esterase/lipase
MKSDYLIDPELKPFLTTLPQEELLTENLPDLRRGMKEVFAKTTTTSMPQADVAHHRIPGPAGAPDVRVVSYRPFDTEGQLPGMLHLHGGGYVLGSPEMMDTSNRRLASGLGCMIVSVDYRLAPETRFPGPLEDSYAALVWLHENAGQLGIDSSRIGVKGESAGGGLAAALALLTRERAGPPLAFQHLIYPMIDDRTGTGVDGNQFTGEFVWTAAQNRFGWSSLLGIKPGCADTPLHAAAARAPNLKGLPPTFIGIGSLDLFLEENLAFAHRLSRAGVATELHVYPGAFHRFLEAQDSRVAQAADRDSREALRRALHP